MGHTYLSDRKWDLRRKGLTIKRCAQGRVSIRSREKGENIWRRGLPLNELLLKLFFGVQVPVEILIGYVERMVERECVLVLKFTQAGDEEIVANQKYPDALRGLTFGQAG